MNVALRVAYRRIPSFRRECGGSYALYARVNSSLYGRRMTALHRKGRHGRLLPNGRCTWCGHGPENRYDPVANIEAAMDYILAAYANGNED